MPEEQTTETEVEIWKDVPGYLAKASSFGNIKVYFIRRYCGWHDGEPRLDRGTGYLRVNCYTTDKQCKTVYVHKLVALAFLGPRPHNDDQINHKDCNKIHNKPSNLEYGSRSSNMQHAISMGIPIGKHGAPKGIKNPNAKLTEDDIRMIRRLAPLKTRAAIAERFKVSTRTISTILAGETWSQVIGSDVSEAQLKREISTLNGPRVLRGSNNGNSVLTEDEVREIRRLHKEGVPTNTIAWKFLIAAVTVQQIVRRDTWKHVTDSECT